MGKAVYLILGGTLVIGGALFFYMKSKSIVDTAKVDPDTPPVKSQEQKAIENEKAQTDAKLVLATGLVEKLKELGDVPPKSLKALLNWKKSQDSFIAQLKQLGYSYKAGSNEPVKIK